MSKIVKFPKALTVFTLAMINVAAIGSVKNWPFSAEFGFSSLFYFIVAALIFFFPVSFVSAELATGWPKKGGVYLWVKEAFGPKWGFLAAWLLWVENIVWYPTVLSFTAATIAYIFNPALSGSIVYTVVTVLVLFWLATIVNLFGMKTSGWVSNVGAICGTFIPGFLIILLGIFWILEGAPLQIEFSWNSLVPKLDFSHMVFFTGVMLAFAGMEMSSVHALEVRNPQKSYPRAIFLSAMLIVVVSILGVLSIAMVVPKEEISFTAGTMQAFVVFFERYKLTSFVPLMAISIAIGLFGSVSTWIIGPIKALQVAALDGHLPHFLDKTNKKNAPYPLMICQGIIVTLLCLMFLLMPSVDSAFWILTVLVAQLYLIMYILMFAAALRLRYKHPNVPRAYKVPGGNLGMWIVCGIGILGSTFALLIGYVPPQTLKVGSNGGYIGFLIGGTLIGCLAPFVIRLFYKSHQVAKPK